MSFRVVPTVLLTLLIGTAALPASVAAQAPERSASQQQLHAAKTFIPALGVNLTTKKIKALAKRDVVVVDGELTTGTQVAQLRARGALVLGYLSVGSIESWRSWYPLLKDYRLEELADWDGEHYTDVSNSDARDVLADQIAPELLDKGFDGLFLDLVDMVEDHPQQQPGMLDLVTRIAARVHAAGHLLMAQNGDSIIDPFVPLLDGWNREDPTGTYDFEKKRYVDTDTPGRRIARATMKRLGAAGLVVTSTDYYGSPTSAGAKRAIRIACQSGAVPFVGEITLSKVPAKAPHCS